MRFTDLRWPVGGLGGGLVALLCGCSQPPASPGATGSSSTAAAAAGRSGTAEAEASLPEDRLARHAARTVVLPAPRPVANWDEVRRQAAHRLVSANPDGTYTGAVPETLLAIPVLEVELRRDGSVARIIVLRAPRQAKDTSALAIAAVHRAAPFGDVSRLPRPWRFTETFLFDEARKFKPRTLDE